MPPPAPPPSLSREVLRIGSALMLSAGELWGRWLDIGVRHGRAAAGLPPEAATAAGRPTPVAAFRHVLEELALAPWLAWARLGEELGRRPTPAPRVYTIAGRPLVLPARVQDAAQGLALYAVPEPAANAILAARGVPARATGLGRGVAGLALFGVRYRVSDLGTFEEMGAALLVVPEGDPWASGLYFLLHPVTGAFSCEAGNVVWGYPKTLEPIDSAWGPRHVTWRLRQGPAGPPLLAVTFPRGGAGASVAVPMPTYTLLDGTLHRTVFTRTGVGERIQVGGGEVALALGDPAACGSDPRWAVLRALGLGQAPPILHAWTEHLSGEFGPPVPVG